MLQSETTKKFLKIENDYDLLSKTIDGFRVWAYMRFNIYMKIEEVLNRQEKRILSEHLKVSEMIKALIHCTLKNPMLFARKKEVLFFSHARRQLIDNKFHCIYTDELAQKIGSKAITAEFIYGTKHLEPVFTSKMLYLDYVDIVPALTIKLKRKKYNAQKLEIASFVSQAIQVINKEFGIQIDIDYYSKVAQKRYIWYVMKKRYLQKLLKRVNPRIIVEVVSYETNKMIINEIARDMGIPTFELQHGVISPGHIAYNYTHKNNYNYLPSYLLVFSDYWRHVASFPFNDERILSVGYPYLDYMLKKYPKQSVDNKDFTIIILSQPEYSVKLYNETIKLIKYLDSNAFNYKIIYKLHPAEYSTSMFQMKELLSNKKVEIIHSADRNLYELFSQSDVQVGVTSTAIFEGVAYGLKALIFHFEKTDAYMGQLCETDAGEMFDSTKQMADRIIEICNNKYAAKDYFNILFKKNACNNIIEIITNYNSKNGDTNE